MYAGVGIMAGSYAHNIKNLLVRPLDLLRRCIANKALDQQSSFMLGEVENTLGAVAVRLEQILNAVRRQGDKFEPVRFDLKELVCRTVANWNSIADDKWKIDLEINVQLEGESFINADPRTFNKFLKT